MSKYTIFFERFSNRPLARWELDVIAALEYIRQHGDNHRIVLVDPPGYDSRKLLCEYYSYIHHRIDSYGNFLVMAKTKRDAATLSGFISKSKTPWLTPASGNHPDNIRGLTFNYALLLDCQAYIAKTPKSANRSHSANNSTFKIRRGSTRSRPHNTQQRPRQLHNNPHPQRIYQPIFNLQHQRLDTAHLYPRPTRSRTPVNLRKTPWWSPTLLPDTQRLPTNFNSKPPTLNFKLSSNHSQS